MSFTIKTSLKNKFRDSVEIPTLTKCCFCFPLRKGLIVFAYINLIWTLVVATFLSLYISYDRKMSKSDQITLGSEYSRLIAAVIAMAAEVVMTIAFIVALHKKHVLIMKVFLYFEIIFIIVFGFIYSLAYLPMFQVYLVIVIWSSIVKMEGDGSIKYSRETYLA